MSNIRPIKIEEEVSKSYLDYAMSVIVSRALPDARDGLKPVQRRILYGMWRLNLKHNAKFAKSARIVGSILGYYHPHGDTPVYEALVRMAQDFSLRYPLINGQGNWGSVDGDPPAAQRYTEAKLAAISDEFLEEIDKETVTWRDNFDGTKKEPEFLPAKLPNLLLNGAQGIAVGMATNIPPHNLRELVDALVYLLSHPKAQIDDILPFIKGPDFPTAGIIYDSQAIKQAYAMGRGAIPIRARVEIKEGKYIVVSELPYQVGKAVLISEIADLIREGKREGIQDIIDGSRKGAINIVIELKRGIQAEKVLNQLYHHTRLQRNFNVLIIALVDGIEPRLLSLLDLLRIYLSHRELMVRRRTEFDLKEAQKRAHILEGLALALSHIDAVIQLIKSSKSKEEAKTSLQKEFRLSDVQAQAILEMRLQSLAKLEREAITKELDEKYSVMKELKSILETPKKIQDIIKKEFLDLKERFGDKRKTEVFSSPLSEFHAQDLIPQERILIILTKEGYIKRISPKTFQIQARGGVGINGIALSQGDMVTKTVGAWTHDDLFFFSRDGKLFHMKAYEIPEKPRTAKGEGLYEFFQSSSPISEVSVLPAAKREGKETFLTVISKKGLIKKVSLNSFSRISKRGVRVMRVGQGDECISTRITHPRSEVIVVSSQGKALKFSLGEIRQIGREAGGVRGIRLRQGDEVIEMVTVASPHDHLLFITDQGFGKKVRGGSFSLHHRGTSGMKALTITSRTGKLKIALFISPESKNLFINSIEGKTIKMSVNQIPLLGRAAQGVRLIRLKEGDKVASALLL